MAERPLRATSEPPFAGVRVLDLTQVVAGPYCTMMLADMGAEVVKLERAGHGDDLRRTMPYQGREGHQDYYNALNRSKKSIALDLKQPAHRDIALQLAANGALALLSTLQALSVLAAGCATSPANSDAYSP